MGGDNSNKFRRLHKTRAGADRVRATGGEIQPPHSAKLQPQTSRAETRDLARQMGDGRGWSVRCDQSVPVADGFEAGTGERAKGSLARLWLG